MTLQLVAAAFACLLSAACGGQSGAEGRSDYPGPGLPGAGADCVEADVDELPFDPKWIEKLANGSHRTTFRWRDPGVSTDPSASTSDDTSMPAVLEVTQRSGSTTSLRCGGVSVYDADVRLTMNGGEQAFKGKVQGTRRGAFLVAYAGLHTRQALRLPGEALTGEDDPGYQVVARIDEDGIRGDFYFDAGSTGQCALATWPANRTCETWERETSANEGFGDFSFATDASSLVDSEHTLTWKDGSSTALELRIEENANPVCVRSTYNERATDGTQYQGLSQRVTLEMKTADGRIDVRVPATVAVQWNEASGVRTVPAAAPMSIDHRARVTARAVGRFTTLRDTHPDEFDVLELDAFFGSDAVSGDVFLSSLKLENPPPSLTADDAPQAMVNAECWGLRPGSRKDSATFE